MGIPRIRDKVSKMNLDVKLRLYTSILIVVITFVMLIISTVFTVCSLYEKSEEAAKSKLSFVATSYGNWLEENKNTLLALQVSPEIQRFCSYTDKYDHGYVASRNGLIDLLENKIYSNVEVNFISITNDALDTYIYRGNHSVVNTGYEEAYRTGLEGSVPAKTKGNIKVYFGNEFFRGSKYSITFYQPVYSVNTLDKQLGMLTMNINDNLLISMEESLNMGSMQTFLADKDGNLILTDEKYDYLREKFNFKGKARGSISKNGKYYFFQKIVGWNFYVVSAVPQTEMYQSSIDVACVMLLVMLVVLSISIGVIRSLVHKSYAQVSEIITAMDRIAENELSFRIETNDMGEDFKKLGNGFNNMMDEINKLMITVRDEQYQIDQIRLQALQSQIKPHFLYNTLECIHWQSMADGNKQVSKMVMALASYYRLSLSKGKDIISLRDEVQHIKYYLVIQNLRFSELIHSEINVDEEMEEIKIPKLTLQPLVENAIYHGIRVKDGSAGTIEISAKKIEDEVVIKVDSSGKEVTQEYVDQINQSLLENDDTFGYGVRNVNKRIELLFGEKYGLEYKRSELGGVCVLIHLPVEFDKKEESIFGGGQNV